METNRQRAEELLCKKSKISIGCLVADYKQKCITPEIAIDAMLAFRNEGLREELVKFLKEYHKSMFVIDLENTNIDYGEIVDEYLNTKQ